MFRIFEIVITQSYPTATKSYTKILQSYSGSHVSGDRSGKTEVKKRSSKFHRSNQCAKQKKLRLAKTHCLFMFHHASSTTAAKPTNVEDTATFNKIHTKKTV